MRRRLIVLAVVVVVVAAGGMLAGSLVGNDNESQRSQTSGLETHRLTVDGVDIEITPLQLDDQMGVFAIILDTHKVDLSADLTRSTLDVNGVVRPVEAWSGDGPGGHHREGELRFKSGQRPTGTVRLTLSDFAKPIEVIWELGD